MSVGTRTDGKRGANGRNGRSGPAMRRRGEPTWEAARVFPRQGEWTEEEYLDFDSNYGPQLVELVDGFLEFLPVPDMVHQRVVRYVLFRLQDYSDRTNDGEALMAPCPVRMWAEHLREPDVFFVRAHRIKDRRRPPEGVDVAMEVPSPGKKNRSRDFVEKRRVYAKAKIPEYWIIDPETETITVLTLSSKSYKRHGRYKAGQQAASKLLSGFSLDVAAVFAAGAGKR